MLLKWFWCVNLQRSPSWGIPSGCLTTSDLLILPGEWFCSRGHFQSLTCASASLHSPEYLQSPQTTGAPGGFGMRISISSLLLGRIVSLGHVFVPWAKSLLTSSDKFILHCITLLTTPLDSDLKCYLPVPANVLRNTLSLCPPLAEAILSTLVSLASRNNSTELVYVVTLTSPTPWHVSCSIVTGTCALSVELPANVRSALALS